MSCRNAVSLPWQMIRPEEHRAPGLGRLAAARGLLRGDRGTAWLGICCAIVALVSVHDTVLIVLCDEAIGDFEINPLGRWLLAAHGGDVWLFVLVKLTGTAVACATLIVTFAFNRRVALTAASVVAALQLALLGFLLWA